MIGFEVGTRETKYFKKLLKNISHIKAKKYASDYWKAYNLIDREKRLIGKSHTYNVERMNRLLVTIWPDLIAKLIAILKV